MGVLLILASNTGNTKSFVDYFKKNYEGHVEVCEDFSSSMLEYDRIVFGSYTWSTGKIPKRLKDYLLSHHKELNGKKVFIFGSGNSIYPKFCGAVDGIKTICTDSGASIHSTFKFEQRFDERYFNQTELDELSTTIKKFSEYSE